MQSIFDFETIYVMNMIYFISIVIAVSIYSDFHGSIVSCCLVFSMLWMSSKEGHMILCNYSIARNTDRLRVPSPPGDPGSSFAYQQKKICSCCCSSVLKTLTVLV